MTNVAYRPLTTIEQVFKDLVWTPGIRAGELALEGAVPFFALPLVSEAEEGLINILADWLYNQFILLVDITSIKLLNAEHQAAYDKASLQLKIIAIDKGVNSDDFKKAREVAKLAFSKFTNIAASQ